MRHLTRAAYLLRAASIITEPCAYGLANKGARLLAELGEPINHRLDWSGKNERTEFFLAHTLQVAETMLHFQFATRDIARLVYHQELLRALPQRTRSDRNQWSLRVTLRQPGRTILTAVIPDRLFGLTYPDSTTHHFALELDRGTMDIWANHLVGKSSFRRKLMAYLAAREHKRFAEAWAFKSLRVLTVTTSEERIEHMLAAQRRVAPQCPPGFFLYSTLAQLTQHGALGPAWTNSKGGHVSVLHQVTGCRELATARHWPG